MCEDVECQGFPDYWIERNCDEQTVVVRKPSFVELIGTLAGVNRRGDVFSVKVRFQ